MMLDEKLADAIKVFSDGYELPKEAPERLENFYENLIEWNEKINLTAITKKEDVYTKHFLDSMSILKVVPPKQLSGSSMIDVGTGAGFPGLVLAICFPKLRVTLMDSLNKRVNFLNDTVSGLQLQNVVCIHARAEELARQKNHREKYDYAVSRAVANLSTLCEYCLPFVKVGGTFVAYKSEKVEEEMQAGKQAISLLGGKLKRKEEFILPDTEYHRTLIVIEKDKHTPSKYPRKAGTPSKEPLGMPGKEVSGT